MYKTGIYALAILALYSSCSSKKVKQGLITYDIAYQLPDSLSRYVAFLPKTAQVYFKQDSTIIIQQAGGESTTVISCKPAGFMEVLLKSGSKKYVVDYNRADQAQEAASAPAYIYKATRQTRRIAGYKTTKYQMINKATGEISEAWFTRELSVISSYLTANLDTTYGVPLAFNISEHGMLFKTTVRQVKFQPVADGTFATPAGYQSVTPAQLKAMPVDNQ